MGSLEGAPTSLEDYLGMIVLAKTYGEARMELSVRKKLMAPNGFLHAGTLASLVESAIKHGTRASLPAGVVDFSTIEIKLNHLATTREGTLVCLAKAVHLGRTTQVWEAVVSQKEKNKTLVLCRCTQNLVYK